MGNSKEIPLPTAIVVIAIVAVVIIAIGWYLMNRNPSPPPSPTGEVRTTTPIQTPRGAVQGQTGMPAEY